MKKNKFIRFLLAFGSLIILSLSCEKENNDNLYAVKIVGFDPNCSTCIIEFPSHSTAIKRIIGESTNNHYNAINLDKNEFKIGQMLQVKVRKAMDSESNSCITFYPSTNYKEIFLLDYEIYRNIKLNDTIELSYQDCLSDPDKQCNICFDSVLTDSRCPIGVTCFWAGEAKVRFKIEKYNCKPVVVDLSTGVLDTVINEYKISFFDLLPHPNIKIPFDKENYKAKMVVKQI
jgi:hypothetical protein